MLINLDSARHHFDLLGEPDRPLLCMLHSICADSGMWAEQVQPLLEAGMAVLRIDIRGHGGTQAQPGPYSMEALADDVAGIIGHLGLGRVHLIGLSIGGMIAQTFALRNGDRLRSLILCDTLPQSPPKLRPLWAARLSDVAAAGSLAPVHDSNMKGWLTPAFRLQQPARWQQISDTIMATSIVGYAGCVAAIQNFDIVDRIGSIAAPTLVLCGALDDRTPSAENRSLAEHLPSGLFIEIPGARHLPNVECPERFNQHLVQWLKTQENR